MTEEEYNNLQYDIEQAQLSNIEKKKKEIAEKKKSVEPNMTRTGAGVGAARRTREISSTK